MLAWSCREGDGGWAKSLFCSSGRGGHQEAGVLLSVFVLACRSFTAADEELGFDRPELVTIVKSGQEEKTKGIQYQS